MMSSLQGFSHIACVLFHPLICSNRFVSPTMFSWISLFFRPCPHVQGYFYIIRTQTDS